MITKAPMMATSNARAEYASTLRPRGESSRRAISQMTPAPTASALVTIQAQRS
jgi:hypothetical protein